jgi:diguanylate cyclase (GGDEF)-like protein/PAS domain S-box-containing protein
MVSFERIIELFEHPAWVWSPTGDCLARNAAVRPEHAGLIEGAEARGAILRQILADPEAPVEQLVKLCGADGQMQSYPCRFIAWSQDGSVSAVIARCSAPRPDAATGSATPAALDAGADEQPVSLDLERLQRLAKGFPAALFEFHGHPDGTISLPFFNQKAADLFGVSVQEMRQNALVIFERIHPDDKARVLEARQKAMRTGQVNDIKFRVNHPTRGTIWVHMRAYPQPRQQNDEPHAFYGTIHDVTEQMEAEARASEAASEVGIAQERLARIAEYSPVSIYEIRRSADGAFFFDFLTKNHAQLVGVPYETMMADAQTAFTNAHEDDQDMVFANLERSARDLTLLETTCRVIKPGGEQIWGEFRALPRRLADGSTVWYGVGYDVTEQKGARLRLDEAIAQNEQTVSLLNNLASNAPAGMAQVLIQPDGSREVVYLNSQLHDLLGVTRAEYLNSQQTAFANLHPDDRKYLITEIAKNNKSFRPVSRRCRRLHPDGSVTWLIHEAAPRLRDDGVVEWNSSSLDITEQVRLERRAREALDRLQRIADSVPVGLYETLKEEGGRRRLDFANKRFIEMVGITATDPEDQWGQLLAAIHPEDRERTLRMQKNAPSDRDFFRFRIKPKAGETIWVGAMVTPYLDAKGMPALAGAFTDITQDVEREKELQRAHHETARARQENEHQALHDSLTGLPNRRYFDAHMARLFDAARAGAPASRVTLIRIDGDRFKYVNDTFGHEAGDAVLQRIGEVMRQECRRQDFPARVGGDEFSVLLQAADQENEVHAAALVARIRKSLSEPLHFDGHACNIEASFGVATVDAKKESPEDLLLFADAALYRAKDQGRNRMELFTPELRQEITDERQIISDLHRAIERDQIDPYFQVQVDTMHGTLAGVEALMRWRHPSRGVLAPDTFLYLADKLRITADLDRHMKHRAHMVLRDLRAQGTTVPRVSFNASAGRLRDKEIVSDVKRLIDDGFPVALELLESIMVEEENDAFRFTLDSLREIGVELEIDDFGSGRSSVLGLLEVNPVALKIDRRLISHLEEEPSAQKLVRAIVDIAEALDIGTICEGVERAGQITTLQSLGCFVMQGYYFSRALCARDLAKLLADPPWQAQRPRLTGS